MLVIKRYPNRKLYDTEAKRYITLDGITELIHREGPRSSVACGRSIAAKICMWWIMRPVKT